jgi:dTDP-4-amino-4,6-dideoxygalactose transaminase
MIMPVDISGWPCDYNELNELVKSNEIKALFNANTEEQEKLGRILIMSDAAHSIGALYNGKRTGSLTDVTVFSFHAVKNLTTSEGGAVCLNLPEVFDCDEIYKTLNIKSLHGQTKDALAKTQVGNWRYDVVEPGYKCNMMDIQAAIGLIELDRYQSTLDRRKEIFNYYVKSFEDKGWAIIPDHKDEIKESSYHLFLLRINGASESQRDEIIQKIFGQGVSVNVHFLPLPMLTAYKSIGYDISDFPESQSKYSNEITLPVYFNLTNDNLKTVVEAVISSVESTL